MTERLPDRVLPGGAGRTARPPGGLVGALLEALGEKAPGMPGLLRALAESSGVEGLRWCVPGGERGGRGVHARELAHPREADWAWLARLLPGTVARVPPDSAWRSPRLGLAPPGVAYARPSPGTPPGVLEARGAGHLSSLELVELADLVARLLAERDERARRARERREVSLGRAAAALLHDLRNQLTLATFELESARDPAGQAPSAEPPTRAAEAALVAARELCQAALPGAAEHARPSRARAVFLRPLLTEIARGAPRLARTGADVRLLVQCAGDLQVCVDPTALSRLVQNLVVNAVEACARGAAVRLAARALEDGRVELVVADEGRGLGRERLASLFEPGISGGPAGAGYGTQSLAACLEELAGELSVESEPARGTTVRVRLSAAGAQGGSAPVVVLVDADRARSAARARSLREAGLAVREARDAGAAAALVRIHPPTRVLVARGLVDAELPSLVRLCQAEGVPLERIGVRDGDPARLAERLALRAGAG